MRPCSRCGFESADHLSYCVQCGRKFAATAAFSDFRQAATEHAAFAATLAIQDLPATSRLTAPGQSTSHSGSLRQALDSIRYVFVYLQGRLDAEERRRRLVDEREGAVRMAAGALAELGRTVLEQGINSAELTGLLEAVGGAQAQRETAIAELAATETFRSSEETRLAAIERAAETELRASEGGVADVEKTLRQVDEERKTVGTALNRTTRDPRGVGDADKESLEREQNETKRARLEQQYDALRERAAALRAASLAARTKVEQAQAGRRQASATLTASLTGHARERDEAERRVQDLTTQIGRIAWQLRLPDAILMPRYDRIERNHQTIADRDRQIATIEATIGRYDQKKLAIGVGLLAGILIAVAFGLWAILR